MEVRICVTFINNKVPSNNDVNVLLLIYVDD